MNWLDRNLPFYSNFMRFQAAMSIRFLSDFSEIDPDFDDPDACSAANKMMRDACLAFLERKLGDDPELVRTMTPPHPYLSGTSPRGGQPSTASSTRSSETTSRW